MDNQPQALIVFGPPASGKSRHARRIAERYGCSGIVDDETSFENDSSHPELIQAVQDGKLILTQANKETIDFWLTSEGLTERCRVKSIYEDGMTAKQQKPALWRHISQKEPAILSPLIMNAVESILEVHENAYSTKRLTRWLEEASKVSGYSGSTSGFIIDIKDDWNAFIDSVGGVPEFPKIS